MKKIPVFKHNTDDDFEIYTKTKVVTTLGLVHFSHYCYIFICFDFQHYTEFKITVLEMFSNKCHHPIMQRSDIQILLNR